MKQYAVISTGGKQYRVSPGTLLDVERLEGEVGKSVKLDSVLAVRKDKSFKVGKPLLKGASVTAKVVAHPRDKKVISFKFERRKGYHRKVGHRQNLTRLQVTEITFNGA